MPEETGLHAVLSLCLCWKLQRQDNFILGLTDHDQPLNINGVQYLPSAALEAGRFTQGLSLKPGQAAAAGSLSSEAITDQDLLAGLWDRCRIDVYQVDWQQPGEGRTSIWHGYLSEIRHQPDGQFEAELISVKADLERLIGRVLSRRCDAELGDARCGISASGRICDQRFETCRDVFHNTMNYRGFPHIPGTDFILSGPASTGNDGGRR